MQLMNKKETSNVPKDTSFLLAEYKALRDEVLKRMDMENQLMTFTVIVFGTILGVGFQNKLVFLILLYPTLAMFFAVGWSHSVYMTCLIGTYIKDCIEAVVAVDTAGWEHYLTLNRPSLYAWAAKGIFIVTELLAITVGVSLVPLNTTFIAILLRQPMTSPNFAVDVLLCIALVSLILTYLVLRQAPIKHIHVPAKLIKLNTN